MKRLFTTILALSLSLMLLIFSGCLGAIPLTFNNAFNGAQEPDSSYRETLTYAVSYGNYEDLTRSALIDQEQLKYSATGEYKTTFETVTKNDLPEQALLTDINLTAGTGNIYHLTTSLNLNVTYTVNGEGSGDYLDTIYSEVYFLPSGMSFAPIFSKVNQVSSYLTAENGGAGLTYNVKKIESETTILYNQSSYKITYKLDDSATDSNHDYSFKTVIDNAELLFAMRNLALEKDANTSIPTVSASYGQAKGLLITNGAEFETTLNINVNGAPVNEKVSVKKLDYHVNESNNTGVPQYVTVQKSASGNIPSKALMTEYAHATMCYGTNTITGALIYKLTSVEFSK